MKKMSCSSCHFGEDCNVFFRNGALALILFYLSALFLAAILAPIMFFFVKYCADNFSIEIFAHFIEKGFPKFFDRAKIFSLMVLLFPFLRACDIKLVRDISFKRVTLLRFCAIFAAGFLFVHVIYFWLAASNCFVLHEIGVVEFFIKLLKFIIASVFIAFFEETIFRGIILRLFSRSFNSAIAVILTSIFFAYCHFGVADFKIATSDVTILSGFQCILPTLTGICSKFNLLNFCNLTVLGILLSALLLKFGSLLCPIAFHIAVVLAIMNIRSFLKVFSVVDGGRVNIGILDIWLTFVLQVVFVVCILLSTIRQKSLNCNNA